MLKPHLPLDETQRLAALANLEILDTPPEERYERVVRLARMVFNTPIAAITAIDSDRQWFKSIHGLSLRETSRDVSFCGHTILGESFTVVRDTLRDERFADNPLVIGAPHIRFYAGHPICAQGGERIATLCVIDRRPRSPSEEKLNALRDLAALAGLEIRQVPIARRASRLVLERDEAERRSLHDDLSQLLSRRAIRNVLEAEITRSVKQAGSVAVLFADLDRFKAINDRYGHPTGDRVIQQAAKRMKHSIAAQDHVGRYGGEEFLIVVPECGREAALGIAERMRSSIEENPLHTPNGDITVTASIGVAVTDRPDICTAEALIRAADRALYQAKRNGRNRVVVA